MVRLKQLPITQQALTQKYIMHSLDMHQVDAVTRWMQLLES